MDKEKTTRQRLAEWSKTPEGRESYEKVAEEMRMELALDDEVKNYFKEWVDEDTDSVHNGCAINDSNQYVSLCDCARIARHFAQWGANHTPLPEDTVLFNKGVAEGKRLMMEEAVETTVVESYGYEKGEDGKWRQVIFPTIHTIIDGCSFGDKVKIIIIKEGEK